ncbi:hypothetical protein E2C01_072283 [Portunus trituberculatus]|uniref:Uncharacterized protein n=1 Tax=Portunus trituberculatus TaxID=210409 RepID=A0A5B7I8J2_PORTR|nr:hypothetical protein [Portunus trituberculatus]
MTLECRGEVVGAGDHRMERWVLRARGGKGGASRCAVGARRGWYATQKMMKAASRGWEDGFTRTQRASTPGGTSTGRVHHGESDADDSKGRTKSREGQGTDLPFDQQGKGLRPYLQSITKSCSGR